MDYRNKVTRKDLPAANIQSIPPEGLKPDIRTAVTVRDLKSVKPERPETSYRFIRPNEGA